MNRSNEARATAACALLDFKSISTSSRGGNKMGGVGRAASSYNTSSTRTSTTSTTSSYSLHKNNSNNNSAKNNGDKAAYNKKEEASEEDISTSSSIAKTTAATTTSSTKSNGSFFVGNTSHGNVEGIKKTGDIATTVSTVTARTNCRDHQEKFPVKLMRVLDCGQYHHIISWSADGLSIVIHKPMNLVEKEDGSLLPQVISEQNKNNNNEQQQDGNDNRDNGAAAGTKFKSLLRKLYRWGFLKRYTKANDFTYFHKSFQRGKLILCMGIVRLPSTSRKKITKQHSGSTIANKDGRAGDVNFVPKLNHLGNHDFATSLLLQNTLSNNTSLTNGISHSLTSSSNLKYLLERTPFNAEAPTCTASKGLTSAMPMDDVLNTSSSGLVFPPSSDYIASLLSQPSLKLKNKGTYEDDKMMLSSSPTLEGFLSPSTQDLLQQSRGVLRDALLKKTNIESARQMYSAFVGNDNLIPFPFTASHSSSPCSSSFQDQALRTDDSNVYNCLMSPLWSVNYDAVTCGSLGHIPLDGTNSSSLNVLQNGNVANNQQNSPKQRGSVTHAEIMNIALKGLLKGQNFMK